MGVDRSQGALRGFSPKENHSSRYLSDHSHCETALEVDSSALGHFPPTAFSLLVFTERPLSTWLFLKKSRTSLPSPVQSRSENALMR